MLESLRFNRPAGLSVVPVNSKTARGVGAYLLICRESTALPPTPVIVLVTSQAILDLGNRGKTARLGQAMQRRLLDLP